MSQSATATVTPSSAPVPAREILRLEGVSRIFHTDEVETHALAAIDLTVNAGEWVAIAGPSGSGKSTLLAILGLLDAPSQGNYLFDGKPTAGLAAAERALLRNQRIGFIFQSFNLIGDLSVSENVELPLTYRGLPAAERKRRVEAALAQVEMSHRANHFPAQLSGGQQQRVAVARALAGEPLLLLADEPTGNLDSQNGQMVMELLAKLHAGGATICMVTHNPAHTRAASRTVHMLDGRVVPSAP